MTIWLPCIKSFLGYEANFARVPFASHCVIAGMYRLSGWKCSVFGVEGSRQESQL